jgi:hypothetical protein
MPDAAPTPDAINAARDRIAAALAVKPVPVDGFPDLFARKWLAGERVEVQRAHKGDSEPTLFARMFVLTACDAAGVRPFTADDIPAVRDTFDGEAVEAVVSLALKLNGIGGYADPKA